MSYTLKIGMRYLRSKKRSTVSLITVISITGVALGVAAFLCVRAITGGFQLEFRDKVLGVNAHVLVLKYGVDYDEYRDVIETALEMPEVAGAGPFLINEMMMAHGDRLGAVLVKGVDPQGVVDVLDLPGQIVEGSLDGLRREGAEPPTRPGSSFRGGSLDDWLEESRDAQLEGGDEDPPGRERAREPEREPPPLQPESERLPEVETLSPSDVEAMLAGGAFSLGDDGQAWDERFGPAHDEGAAEPVEATADLPGIVVGRTLAETLNLEVGARVKLISPLTGLDVSAWEPGLRTPKSIDFRVIAIFEAGFQEYDSRLVYTDLYEAQRFYRQGDSVTGVEMRLHDLDEAAGVARRLERELGGPFHTIDWGELNRSLFTALEVQKVALSLVIATIIFVAAFNVVATLIMIVLEKKREIAILKAMGATDLMVLGIFMVQGLVIGLVGTLLGLVLGGGIVAFLQYVQMPLDPKVYLIDHLPVVMNLWEFAVTVVVAMSICLLATIAPSWWAARMMPVEGLRYE